MKKINLIIIVFAAVSCLFFGDATAAQNKCLDKLYFANKEYQAGKFSIAIDALKDCIENGFTRIEKAEAHRLLALSYLGLGEKDKARAHARLLLVNKPDYKDFPYVDPAEMQKLLSEIVIVPRLEVGLSAGMNANNVRQISNYTLAAGSANYLTKFGFQAGILFEYNIGKNISLSGNVIYEGLSFRKDATFSSGWNQKYTESLHYFGLPVSVRYGFYNKNNFLLYMEGGIQASILHQGNANIFLESPATNEKLHSTIDRKSQRSNTVFYAFGGIGFKHKMRNGIFGVCSRFSYGLKNIVKSSARYDHIDWILANQFIDSDIGFMTSSINFSFQFPLLYSVK